MTEPLYVRVLKAASQFGHAHEFDKPQPLPSLEVFRLLTEVAAALRAMPLQDHVPGHAEALQKRIEFLEGTLQPFSDAAEDAAGYPDNHAVGCDPAMELSVEIDEGAFGPLKVIHLRRARSALIAEEHTEAK